MRKFILKIIREYQKSGQTRQVIFGSILPLHSSCRYSPTCSEYAYQAVKKYGTIKGLSLGLIRILSCNPLGGHGYKPLA